MAYEIVGETIKSAISMELANIFNNPTRYKEPITNMKYPNFFIKQVNLITNPAGSGNRIALNYLINIQYRHVSDVNSISNLEQILDNIGLQLCSQLNTIQLERPVKVTNKNYEKDQGILQFFCNVTVYAKPEKPDLDKFKDLKLKEEVV